MDTASQILPVNPSTFRPKFQGLPSTRAQAEGLRVTLSRFFRPRLKRRFGTAGWVNYPSHEEVDGGYSNIYEIKSLLLHLVNGFVIMQIGLLLQSFF